MSLLLRVLRRAGAGLVGLAVLGCLVASHQGVRFVPVLTGSMTPYAPAGSLVLTVPLDGRDVAVGDVVAFRPPAPYEVAGNRPVMHRVVALDVEGGQPYMVTQGDANPVADPWRVATSGSRFHREVLVLPHLGRVVQGGLPAVGGLFVLLTVLGAGLGRLVRRLRAHRSGGTAGPGAGRPGPTRQTVTVALHVPREQWDAVGGEAQARARAEETARAALERSVAGLGLALDGELRRTVEPDRGGVRLTLTAAAAVPA